jgi:tetratricopeptide (TPR) repeat protein
VVRGGGGGPHDHQHVPSDVDAFNRLGKALTEMGEYEDALRAYERALDLEPGNAIARKNLERIDALGPEMPRTKASNLDPALFIAHTGKAGIASVNGVKVENSARLTAGDVLSIKAKGGKVVVSTVAGEVLGEVEPKIAVRLLRLMEGGNKYEAAVAGLPNGVLRIVIRETYQHPSQAGKVSFPAANGETVRAYVKERLVRQP